MTKPMLRQSTARNTRRPTPPPYSESTLPLISNIEPCPPPPVAGWRPSLKIAPFWLSFNNLKDASCQLLSTATALKATARTGCPWMLASCRSTTNPLLAAIGKTPPTFHPYQLVFLILLASSLQALGSPTVVEVGSKGNQIRKPPFRVVIEGWRFVPHSYAIVSSYLFSELANTDGIELFFTDLPLFNPNWTRYSDTYPQKVEERLLSATLVDNTTWRNVTIRVSFPFDASPRADNTPVFVVGTSECLTVSPRYWTNRKPPQSVGSSSVKIVTHSLWSATGFINVGVPARNLEIIPLGVDVSIFRPFTVAKRLAGDSHSCAYCTYDTTATEPDLCAHYAMHSTGAGPTGQRSCSHCVHVVWGHDAQQGHRYTASGLQAPARSEARVLRAALEGAG
jgi:hypothetical protein